MKPFDRQLDADVQDELDRLEAALHGESDADPTLRALVEDVRAVRPTLDADARERVEDRVRVASDGAAGAGAGPGGTGTSLSRTTGAFGRRRWRVAAVAAIVVVAAVPVAGVVLREESGEFTSMVVDESKVDDPMSGSGSVTRVPASKGDSITEDGGSGPLVQEQSLSGEAPTLDGSTRDSASPEPAPSAGRTTSGSASSAGSASSSSSLRKDRSVIRDARQTVRVARSGVAAAASKVADLVADQDGYVASSSVSETGGSPRAEFEIVVPSARLDATIAAIGRIGTPVRLERSSVDVTDQRVSIDDRLRDLRADRSSVRLQLARATEPKQRAAKRRELRLLSSRIARLEGEQKDLRGQVSTARLSLRLTTARGGSATSPAEDDGRWGLADAWEDAGRVLQVVGGVLLIAVVVLVPLAVIVGLLLLGSRRLTSHRKNRTIEDG